jgi:hypothetical protein
MDIIRAKEIVSLLAEGVDPTTGEVLPEDHVYNKAEVVRALYTVLNHMDDDKPKKELPENAGKPWTTEDDEKLKQYFLSGISRKEICTAFGRTSGSITSRLVRLGMIEQRKDLK